MKMLKKSSQKLKINKEKCIAFSNAVVMIIKVCKCIFYSFEQIKNQK